MIQNSDNNTAIVICGHGSRNKNYLKNFLHLKDFLSSFFKKYNFFHCFIEINRPSIEVCLENLIHYEKIIFVPFLIFSGRHFEEDVLKKIKKHEKKIVVLERFNLIEEVAKIYTPILKKNIKRNIRNFLVTCGSFSKKPSLALELKNYTNRIAHELKLDKSMTFLTGQELETIKNIKNELKENDYRIILHPVFLFRGYLYQKVSKIFLKNFKKNLKILDPITQQKEFVILARKKLVSALNISN